LPLIKRSFFIKCRGEDCLKLAEMIREKMPSVEQVEVVFKNDGLYITMYGYKSDVQNAWRYLKSILPMFKPVTKDKGCIRINLDYLFKKLKNTFPPRLIVEILSIKGFKADYDDERNELVTNAGMDIVEEYALKIIELMNEVKYRVKGTTTKYYVVASAILTNQSIDEVINIGLNMNHLTIVDDKPCLRIEWRKAIRDFIANTSSKHI